MNKKIAKIGERGRHVRIPDGWFIVYQGEVKDGDKFYSTNTKKWYTVEDFDIDEMTANEYDLLIRNAFPLTNNGW